MPVATQSAVRPVGVSTNPRSIKVASLVASKPAVDIIDIRTAAVELNLKEEIHTLLKPRDGPRTLPTLLLYDERGLQLFEEVTSAPEGGGI